MRHENRARVAAPALLLLLVAAPLSAQLSAQPSPLAEHPRVAESIRLLEAWMDGQRTYEQVPGMSAAVVRGGELVWSHGFGLADREAGTPATPETVYSICSISKLFTSIAVMRLRDAGELALGDPVGDHLPWFDIEQAYPDGPPVTVWGLLTHSSGLPRESDYPYWSEPDFAFPTRDEMRGRLAEQETLYPAARHYQYSNLGLTLAGEIVAEVSGRPYADYVRDEVLTPLGLADTRPRMPSASEEPRLAAGYGSLDRHAERHREAPFDARGITPAAGFSSTALDLARFAGWQLRLLDENENEGEGEDDTGPPPEGVLSANTLREMQRVQWLEPDWQLARGLGFGVYRRGDTTYVGHSGSCPGYRTTVLVDHASNLGVAVLANAMVGVETYARRAFEILGPALAEAAGADDERDDEEEATESEAEAEPALDLERFAGAYSLQPWGGEAAVVPWKGGLAMVYLPDDDPLGSMDELRPVDPETAGNDCTFRRKRPDGELGETVVFELDESGHSVAFVQHSNRYPRVSDLGDE